MGKQSDEAKQWFEEAMQMGAGRELDAMLHFAATGRWVEEYALPHYSTKEALRLFEGLDALTICRAWLTWTESRVSKDAIDG